MEKKFVYEKPQLVEYPYFGKIVASGEDPKPGSVPPGDDITIGCDSDFDQ